MKLRVPPKDDAIQLYMAGQPAASWPAGQTAPAVNLSQTLHAVFDRARWTLRGSEPRFGISSKF